MLKDNNYKYRTLFVPAILEGHASRIRAGIDFKGYDIGWCSDKSFFKHPLILTSYYYAQKSWDYRKDVHIDKDVVLFADSGGYTIASKGVHIEPAEVLKWQEFNSDVALSLDYPPDVGRFENATKVSRGTTRHVTNEEFIINAKKSFGNNAKFAELRTNDNLKIYNIIHGKTLQLLETWWKVNSVFSEENIYGKPFEGFAGGVKPAGDAMLQALNGAFFMEKGVKSNLHFLGVSGLMVIPVLVWLSQYIDNLSFDATSYAQGALSKKYMLPSDLTQSFSFGKEYKPGSFKPVCNCPVCSKIDDYDILAKCDSLSGILISLHNLYLMKMYTEQLEDALKVSQNDFYRVIEKHTSVKNIKMTKKTVQAIEFLESVRKNGLVVAYNHYFTQGNPTVTRINLL